MHENNNAGMKTKRKTKCRATIIAVDHHLAKPVLERFKKFVKKKSNRLFVECTTRQLKTKSLGSYKPLVEFAARHKMVVVPLDASRLLNRVVQRIEKIGVFEEAYADLPLRERKWVLLLRSTNPGDIVLLHPGHAYRIAPFLGIDRSKVVWIHKPDATLLSYKRWGVLGWRNMRKFKERRNVLREQRKRAKKKPKL